MAFGVKTFGCWTPTRTPKSRPSPCPWTNGKEYSNLCENMSTELTTNRCQRCADTALLCFYSSHIKTIFTSLFFIRDSCGAASNHKLPKISQFYTSIYNLLLNLMLCCAWLLSRFGGLIVGVEQPGSLGLFQRCVFLAKWSEAKEI